MPSDDPSVAEFVDNLDRINGSGKRMPGFVWIVEGSGEPGTGNTDVKIDGDPQLVAHFTVWEDFPSLSSFVYDTLHSKFLARGHEWFEQMTGAHFVMWWVPVGHRPTMDEALAKLAHRDTHRYSDAAFGWDYARGQTRGNPPISRTKQRFQSALLNNIAKNLWCGGIDARSIGPAQASIEQMKKTHMNKRLKNGFRKAQGVTLAIGFAVLTTGAHALPSLAQVGAVNDGLRSVAIADEIRENCGSISARMIRALSFVRSIESYAQSQGYSDAEIEAFVGDRTEKNRLKADARAYMMQQGVVTGDEASYCTLGQAEIAAGSQIGALLRSR